MTHKVGLALFLMFVGICSVYAQNSVENEAFKQRIERYATNTDLPGDLKDVCHFFKMNNWDSALVLTEKVINSHAADSLLDYCHYIRGVSFFSKRIFGQALNSFYAVSAEFDYNHLLSIRKGEVFLELSNFDSAVFYFKKAGELVNSPQAKDVEMSKVHHNLGISYMHLGQYKEAENYLIKSIDAQEKDGDTTLLVGSYGDLANTYYEQYKDDLAIPLFLKAYQFAGYTNSFLLKQNTALNMAVVEENRKDFVKSLKFRKEYEMWRDSLTDQNRIYEVAQLEKQNAIEKKQQEVSILKVENDLRRAERNGLIYLAIALLLLLTLAIYFYRVKVKSNQTIMQQKEALNELNEMKNRLFSVVSHDLRTAVSSLKNNQSKLQKYFVNNDFQKMGSLIVSGSSMANGTYNLLDNLFQWALLQTEQSYFYIESLRLYYIIEQVAYNYEGMLLEKGLDFNIQIPKDTVVYADQETLKITLRNLIDNAIKYTNREGAIKIYPGVETHNYCDLIIEDCGVGMSDEAISLLTKDNSLNEAKSGGYVKGSGLGLQLCQTMVQKNFGQFKVESALGEGTKITITLMKIDLSANGKD